MKTKVEEGDVVKTNDKHRYLVVEADGGHYEDFTNGFGARRIHTKGIPTVVKGKTYNLNECFRSLSVSDVLSVKKGSKTIKIREAF